MREKVAASTHTRFVQPMCESLPTETHGVYHPWELGWRRPNAFAADEKGEPCFGRPAVLPPGYSCADEIVSPPRGACPVVLQTPYGIARSSFMAVDSNHKLDADNNPIPGKVGHDRIQQATGEQSIGEAIRHWYGLKRGDFERIDVEAVVHPAGHFILIPTSVTFAGRRPKQIEKIPWPLSLHKDYQSKLWRSQIGSLRDAARDDFDWAATQVRRSCCGTLGRGRSIYQGRGSSPDSRGVVASRIGPERVCR